MEHSKLIDLDAVQLCLEILRPQYVASAYNVGAKYLTADLDRCGLSANGRAHISLRLYKEPEATQCPIYGLQVVEYCTARKFALRSLWEWVRAFYYAYGYAMQMAIAKVDSEDAAAQWLANWYARSERALQPIESAAALLLERRDLTPAEREHTALVLGHCRHPHPAEDMQECLASMIDQETIAAALENLDTPARSAAPVRFSDIVTAKAKDKVALLKWLHTQIDGKGGAFVAAHILALYDAQYILTKNPTQQAFTAEFPECGKWESIAKYLQPLNPPKRPSPSDIYIPTYL